MALVPDRPVHEIAFRKRRALNWLTLGATYATMYMGRYNLSIANKSLSDTYGWDKTQIGAIISTMLTIYGFSALFNGPIADRIGGRRAMLIGVCGAVVANFAFGMGAYIGFLGTGALLISYFSTVWAVNGYFQSYSALSLIKVNSAWFHLRERGVFSAIFGSMIQSGRALVFFIGPMAVTLFPWQWVFFIPAAIMSVMAFLTFLFVQDSPQKAGYEDFDTADATSGDTEKVNFKYLLVKIFTNPVTLTIAAAEFCTGFVRHGFEQWFPRYMQEAQHLRLDSPVFQSGAMAVVIMGILGAFAAGTVSDWLFRSRRPPVAFVGYTLQVACLALIWWAPNLSTIIIAFMINSFAISMVHSMLSGTASMDFGGRKAAASAAGMFDGMQYLGGSVVGVGMGAILMLPLWHTLPKAKSSH
jgi:OPA family glycerol-3-phosphate transporter-like MFS transporter